MIFNPLNYTDAERSLGTSGFICSLKHHTTFMGINGNVEIKVRDGRLHEKIWKTQVKVVFFTNLYHISEHLLA